MALKVDLRHFLDGEGKELALTDQAKRVLTFLTKIVTSVTCKSTSQTSTTSNSKESFIEIDLKCSSRADELSCSGHIEANCNSTGASDTLGIIEWHCDTCKAAGTISNWQGSLWDMQPRILH